LRCGNQRVSEEIAANTRAASELLRALGAEVVEAEYDLPHPDPIWRCLQQVNWANRFSAAPAADRALLSAGFNSGIDAGAATSSVAIARAQAGRSAIFRGVQTQFQSGFDFILTPCVSAPPLPLDIDPAAPLMIDGAEAGDLRADWTAYLSLFDLSGHPAIAIPSGLATNGAPLGVQLVARWGDDMRLLAAAMAFSGRLPPPRLPPVDENARED